MADFSFSMPDDFQQTLSKLAEMDEIAPKMIDAATPIVAESVKRNLQPRKRTGALIDSVTPENAKKSKKGIWQGRVIFKGYEKKGPNSKVSNNQKAISLEYGTSKQAASPFMEKSVRDVESEVAYKMQEVFNQEVGR
jgi:HK97 gp10 family phage protein